MERRNGGPIKFGKINAPELAQCITDTGEMRVEVTVKRTVAYIKWSLQ